MSDFKIGDRVEYFSGGVAYATGTLLGKFGTVTHNTSTFHVGKVAVMIDGETDGKPWHLHRSNLRLAETRVEIEDRLVRARMLEQRATGKTTRAVLQTILDLSNGKDVMLHFGGPGLATMQQAVSFRGRVRDTMKSFGCFHDIFDPTAAGPIRCTGGGTLKLVNIAGSAGQSAPVILTSI